MLSIRFNCSGVLQDPYGEFMVVEDRTQTKETLEEDFNARQVLCSGPYIHMLVIIFIFVIKFFNYSSSLLIHGLVDLFFTE